MKSVGALFVGLVMVAALNLGGCTAKTDVSTTDTTATGSAKMDTGMSSTTTTTTTSTTKDTTVAGEGIEKKVEAKLVLEPGFSDVHVASPAAGTILLTGTAKTKAEMLKADSIAKATDGVTSVQTQIVVK
jgi:osmotically-inducible protein OsmY